MRRIALLAVVLALAACTAVPRPAPVRSSPPPAPAEVVVFLRDGSTAPQRQAIEARLRAIPGATAVHFETREDAYRRFLEAFKDSPDVVRGVMPADLPESFRLRVPDRTAAEKLVPELRTLPGVQDATVPIAATPGVSPTPTG